MTRLAPRLLILLVALVAGCAEPALTPTDEAVRIGDERFDLEVAATPGARYEGLSGRAHELEKNEGMLFVFPSPRKPSFVMRGCTVPLDLLLLDPGGRVVTLHRMRVEPEGTPEASLTRYGSRWPVLFAIELPGGTADRLGIERGDRIDLDTGRLAGLAR